MIPSVFYKSGIMKMTISFLFLFSSILIFSVSSCGSDDTPETGGPFPEPLISEFDFDLDDTAWDESNTEIIIDNGFIILESVSTSGEQFKLVIDNNGVDDYNLAGNFNIASYKPNTSDVEYFGSQFIGQIASFDITSLDYDQKIMSGVFNFDVAKSDFSGEAHSITNGVFKNVAFKLASEVSENSTLSLTTNNAIFQSEVINATVNANVIYVSASKSDRNDDERFMFLFNQSTSNETIALNSFSTPNGRYIKDGIVYRTKASEEMTITNHDTNNQIIEGTFSFEMVNEDSNSDVITVQNGTFSVSY